MPVLVRTIEMSELAEWVRCMDLAFLQQRPAREEYARYIAGDVDPDRTWAAFEADTVVGTLRSFPVRLTVPGPRELRAAALTNVAVAPTHRRRGLLRRMLAGELTASVERNEPLGVLIASEYPIYGRFGYGPAIESATYTIDAHLARFDDSGSGTVELVDMETMRKEAPSLYDAFRVAQPGSIDRSDRWWDRRLGQVRVPGEEKPHGYCLLCRSPSGGIEGYLRYQAEPKWHEMRPQAILRVQELVSLTPAAYRRLWQYCFEVDLVSRVEASSRPVDEPLPWLLADGRAVRKDRRFDFVWVRILDVCRALSARTYLAASRLVFEVHDPLGFAGGRYALEGGPEGATCSRTNEPAELTLPADVLASAYLGGVRLRVLAAGGRVEEHRAGALARADLMFSSARSPWCSTWF